MTKFNNSLPMVNALDGATNFKALIALLIGVLLTGLMIFFTILVSSGVLNLLLSFLAMLIYLTGFSAAGFLSMDKVLNVPLRSISDAWLTSVFTLHRLLGAYVVALLIILAAIAIVALLISVCLIPSLGAFLFTFIAPLSVLIIGAMLVIFSIVAGSVIAPSIWEGNTILQAVAKTWVIAKNKSVNLIINFILLSIIVVILSAMIALVLGVGSAVTAGMSAGILDTGIFSPSNMFNNFFSGASEDSGYFTAASIGMGLLYLMAFTLPTVVVLHGVCINYLQVKEGLDFSEQESKLKSNLAKAKEKAKEKAVQAKSRANDLNKRAMTSAATAESTTGDEVQCPACSASIEKGDLFCGECGHKL